jgi:hypothetical protein
MLWFFVSGACDGRTGHLIAFYTAGAVSSFLKGPVAPAVVGAALFFFGIFNVILRLWPVWIKERRICWGDITRLIQHEFRWLLSGPAIAGLLFGLAVMAGLLLLPVMMTGSWTSVQLMWKENVVRFLVPFDHVEPAYNYGKHIPVFAAPWTFVAMAALWKGPFRNASRASLFVLLSALGILTFFLISGSRRSYYILPLMPALALLSGNALSQWLDHGHPGKRDLMKASLLATTVLGVVAGIGLLGIPFYIPFYGGHWLPVLGALTITGGVFSFLFLSRGRMINGLCLFLLVTLMVETWFFSEGMRLAEKGRTLRAFAADVNRLTSSAGQGPVTVFRQGTASLIFYLNRQGPIQSLDTMADVEKFRQENPAGYVIVDFNDGLSPEEAGKLRNLKIVTRQSQSPKENEEDFVLLAFPGPR